MSDTAITLCSKALVKLGAKSITSFDEETTEAEVASQLYDTILQDLCQLIFFPFFSFWELDIDFSL